MADQRRSHLRVLPTKPSQQEKDAAREAYWAQLRALRSERDRLRAG